LHPDGGQFHALLADYPAIGRPRFDDDCIHVIAAADGAPLSDIRTPEENAAAADAITALVAELTRDEEAALHVSIAGGRKTMGFYLVMQNAGMEKSRALYLVAYDICEPRRLHRVCRYLTGYKVAGQIPAVRASRRCPKASCGATCLHRGKIKSCSERASTTRRFMTLFPTCACKRLIQWRLHALHGSRNALKSKGLRHVPFIVGQIDHMGFQKCPENKGIETLS